MERKEYIKETQFDKENDIEDTYYIETETHDSINDMALSRADTMDRCISFWKKFIEHF